MDVKPTAVEKATKEERVSRILEDMTISQLKQALTSLKKTSKTKGKRPELMKALLNDPKTTPRFLLSFTPTPLRTTEPSLTPSDRSSSLESQGYRKRSRSTGRNKQVTQSKKEDQIKVNRDHQLQTQQKKKSPLKIKTTNLVGNEAFNGHCQRNDKEQVTTEKSKRNKMDQSQLKNRQKMKRPKSDPFVTTIVLWRRPFTTLFYFSLECVNKGKELSQFLWLHKLKALICALICLLFVFLDYVAGEHNDVIFEPIKENFNWCVYWVFLGILSSVGLGTGLHTFLLYLGPHIASVTLAAFECNSVDFPSPPYPNDIICPHNEDPSTSSLPPGGGITIWAILSKVRLEAFMWGLGTALGELLPYFMARAARLSGTENIDTEIAEINELKELAKLNPKEVPFSTRCKIHVEKLIERVGFPGILLMASIPNPLFDLAGITCGYLLVPFWQFFGATAIGKAIVKMHIQKLFVILSFSEHHAEHFVSLIGTLPYLGPKLQAPFQEFFANEKKKLHVDGAAKAAAISKQSWLSWMFDKLVLAMVFYFVVSIINSMAQSCYRKFNPSSCSSKQKNVKDVRNHKVKSN